MPKSVLDLAKELTLALIEAGNVPPEDVHDTLQKTHATLLTLKAQEETGSTISAPVSDTPAVDWRKSITKHVVICLECGESFKQLSVRHLGTHGLDVRSYRAKYGIPRTQPLAARDTVARRRQVVRATRPWEKAPMFRGARARADQAASEPEAAVPRQRDEALTAAAPTRPEPQRKTAPKRKTASQQTSHA